MASRTITISLEDGLVDWLRRETGGTTRRTISGIISQGLALYQAQVGHTTQPPVRVTRPAMVQVTPPPPVTPPTMIFPPNHPLYKPPTPVSADSRDEARDAYDDLHPPKPPFDEWYATQRALGTYP